MKEKLQVKDSASWPHITREIVESLGAPENLSLLWKTPLHQSIHSRRPLVNADVKPGRKQVDSCESVSTWACSSNCVRGKLWKLAVYYLNPASDKSLAQSHLNKGLVGS